MARDVVVRIRFGTLLGVIAVGVLCVSVHELFSDTYTLTTNYPAPSGVYRKLITTALTSLARNEGNVIIGGSNPDARLEVNGSVISGTGVKLPNLATDPFLCAGHSGFVYYNTTSSKFMACDGTSWKTLGKVSPVGIGTNSVLRTGCSIDDSGTLLAEASSKVTISSVMDHNIDTLTVSVGTPGDVALAISWTGVMVNNCSYGSTFSIKLWVDSVMKAQSSVGIADDPAYGNSAKWGVGGVNYVIPNMASGTHTIKVTANAGSCAGGWIWGGRLVVQKVG